MEEELRRLLEKPGELFSFFFLQALLLFFFFLFLPSTWRCALRRSRSPEVQCGATARGDADAAAGGDRGRQERHRGGSGRGQAEVEALHNHRGEEGKKMLQNNVDLGPHQGGGGGPTAE